MKAEIIKVKITDEAGSDWRISTEDDDGVETAPGDFLVTDPDGDQALVTIPVLRALVRAAEAAATGVLLD